MLEWLAVALPIIADNVFGYTLDQSGLGDKIREKIKPDATKAALQHALTITFGHFKQMQAIEQEDFDKQDDAGRSAHDYAKGIWLLVVGGEIEGEEE